MGEGLTELISSDQVKYGILFDLLRRSSNEEDVLTNRIFAEIGSQRKRSLLDIGAADGSITQKLMPYFSEVDAIDRLDHNVYFLESLGINAEWGLWENYKPEKLYDVVLACHLMYYFPTHEWVPEMVRMRQLLKPSGKLIIVVNSQEGGYADFLDNFYQMAHETPLEQIHSSDLALRLQEQGVSVGLDTIESEVIFENKKHYLALCKFFLDHDFNDDNPIRGELERYFNDLPSKKGRRMMQIKEDFIVIGK